MIECASGRVSESDLNQCLERIEKSYLDWETKLDSLVEVVQTVFVSVCQQTSA